MAVLGFARVEDRGLLDPPGLNSGKAFAAAAKDVVDVEYDEYDEAVPVRRAGLGAKKLRRRMIDRLANAPFAPPREVFGQPASGDILPDAAPDVEAFNTSAGAGEGAQPVGLASLGAPALGNFPGGRIFAANVGDPGGGTGGPGGGTPPGGTTPGPGVVTPAVPEPQSWILLILGFGLLGSALRSQRRQAKAAAL